MCAECIHLVVSLDYVLPLNLLAQGIIKPMSGLTLRLTVTLSQLHIPHKALLPFCSLRLSASLFCRKSLNTAVRSE